MEQLRVPLNCRLCYLLTFSNDYLHFVYFFRPLRLIDDLLLELRTNMRRNDLSIFAAVQEATEDPYNIEDVAPVVPRLAQVALAVENGREAATNNHIQEVEQEDLQGIMFDILLILKY